jgi:FKBP-type peptidyl-prolyl cis-trans isomerase FkpA
MATHMKSLSRAPHPFVFVSLIALPLFAVPHSASAATARKAVARAAAAKPATAKPMTADNSVINVPLAPIVPSAQRQCAAKTASGLGYTMLRAASGPKPGGDATVLVNYIGYLAATGAVFDQNTQSPLPVSGVIKGFAEGLQMAGRTGVVRLCIPAAMGYGAQATGPIPANSDLVFQVEVLDFRSAAEIEEMRKARAAESALPKDAEPAAPKNPEAQ